MADVWDLAPRTNPSRVPDTGEVWDLAPAVPGGTIPDARRAKDLGDAIIAGLKASATGLAYEGKLSDMVLPEDAPWYHRLAANAAGVIADLPLSIAGGVAGLVAGGAAGSAVPVVGNVAGAAIGAGAGSFAAPMALREALMDAYTNNYALSWAGAWEIAKSAMLGAAKGGTIGAATFGAGRYVAPFVAPAGKIVAGTAGVSAELAALTTASAIVEQHVPTWQDFMDNAILLGGMKGAVGVAKGLRDLYAQTGKHPALIVADAKKDPALLAYLEEKTDTLPPVYQKLSLDERIKASLNVDARPEAIRSVIGAKDPPKLGEKPIDDPVSYEYMYDVDTLKGITRMTEQLYEPEITKQTRGVVTNKQTAVEALKLVADGSVAEHVIGAAENAAEIYARAHILKGVTQRAYDKVVALKDIPEADMSPRMKLEALAAIEQLSMVLAEYRGARAEAGRALQVFNAIKRDSSLIGEAETLVKLAERKGSLQDIAALVSGLKDPTSLQKFAKEYTKATTVEKVLEAWKASILSGSQTHLANIGGNLTKWIVEVPETALAATLTAVGRAIKGDPLTMAQFKARAFAPIYGLQLGALDSLKVAAEVWRQKGEHLEKADVYRVAIEGKKGEVIRIPFRALQVEDALFRTIAERAEAHIMAVDRVTKEGLHPDTAEFKAKVVEYTLEPEKGLLDKAGQDAIKRVQAAGAEAVFAQRLGPRLESVQRAMAGHPIGFVVPFFRTPVNLVSWALQHTPGLNLMSGRWRNDFAAGGEARARAIARITIGTALAITAYQLTQDGIVTGSGLFDKEQRGTKKAAGWQPNSFFINGKYYSYQRFEPVAKVISTAADLVEMLKSKKFDEADTIKALGMLVLIFGNATVSTTYMSGLANTLNGVTDPDRYLDGLMEQYAASLVPKIVGQTVAAIDPDKREVDGVMDAIQSQLPFLREKLLPKRDVWGEPEKNNKWFEVMPIQVTEASTDKVKTEAVRLQVAIADAPRYNYEKGPLPPKEQRIEYTDVQRDIIAQISGKFAMELLSERVNAPDWKAMPDYAKAMTFRIVIEKTRAYAKEKALPAGSEARTKVRDVIRNEIDRQILEAERKHP